MATSRWVVLRLSGGTGALLLDYADSRGRALELPLAPEDRLVEALAERLGDLVGAEAIAVFLDPRVARRGHPPGRPAERTGGIAAAGRPLTVLSDLVGKAVALAQPKAWSTALCQTVQLTPGPWPGRPPFSLPLDLLTVGAATPALQQAIGSRDWLIEIREDDAGLTASGRWIGQLARRRWLGAETDIMICPAADLPRLSLALRAIGHRPRLLVALTETTAPEDRLGLARRGGLQGTSLLILPFGGGLGTAAQALVGLLRDFAHDRPLHELGRRLDGDAAEPRPALLVSRPEALDDLRLSLALPEITEEVLSLSTAATATGLETLLGSPPAAALRHAIEAVQPASLMLKAIGGMIQTVSATEIGGAFFDRAMGAVTGFARERDGLLPMALMRRALTAARGAEAAARSAAATALRDPDLRAAYLAQQTRTVDVTMRRLGRDGTAGSFVAPHERLVAEDRYRIRVQIGRRSVVSIVSGAVPPIDLLLPPPELGRRHLLHVALYTDDFDLDSPVMQRLELPEVGASEAIRFDVAPRRGLRRAQARIAVYYDLPPGTEAVDMRNHLVQTLLLTAAVATPEAEAEGGAGIDVSHEFSLTARFEALERLQPRLLSLALNEDPSGHKLMIKRGGEALPVRFTEAQVGHLLDGIRGTLEWASRDDAGSGPRFPADRAEGEPADFDAVIWRLAKAGHRLQQELFAAALDTPLEAALIEVARDRDRLVQAVHLVRNFAFPWTAVYDFDLPPDIVGAPTPTVCKDFRRKTDGGRPLSCAECLDHCSHPDKKQAVCVYGFWGTRHQVEQLLAEKTEKPQALRPVGPGAVALAMGLSGRIVEAIPDDLARRLGSSVRRIEDDEDFLPSLWTARRPAVLLLVGHYRTKDVAGEPAGARLTLPGQRFLQPGDILGLRMAHPEGWADPRSVILLAACSGGVVDIRSAVNFVTSFTGVGAGAVIGPEAVIYEGIAHRFAVEMSEALVTGVSVGAAVLAFRRRLLQDLNPLGLMFTAYGFADLAASQ